MVLLGISWYLLALSKLSLLLYEAVASHVRKQFSRVYGCNPPFVQLTVDHSSQGLGMISIVELNKQDNCGLGAERSCSLALPAWGICMSNFSGYSSRVLLLAQQLSTPRFYWFRFFCFLCALRA